MPFLRGENFHCFYLLSVHFIGFYKVHVLEGGESLRWEFVYICHRNMATHCPYIRLFFFYIMTFLLYKNTFFGNAENLVYPMLQIYEEQWADENNKIN